MAQIEPMDIDAIESDFDNKENAFHYNVLSRTPCTEKGYEELDVSELNMKLRYSITPASSPMSKSLTGPCLDNRNGISEDYLNNAAVGGENGNLSRSLNSTLSKTEGLRKSKVLPLQTLSTDPLVDSNRNSVHRLLDPTDSSVIISVNNINDENLSLPSTCSSMPDTPEATSPTKETQKPEGSPIMRGLKSVLSMFRPSQSPIPPADIKSTNLENLSPVDMNKSEVQTIQASTPVAANKQKDRSSSKRSSPLKESLVFNDDLERELQWKDETTILFKEEKIPVHKLLFQNPITEFSTVPPKTVVEHMDISCNESIITDKTMTEIGPNDNSVNNENPLVIESDNEFLDCETTFTKNESDHNKLDIVDKLQVTGNVTVDMSQNAEVLAELKSENKHILNNSICVPPGDITVNTDQASMSLSDLNSIMDKNNTNIIENTNNLVNNESNDFRKVTHNTTDIPPNDELKNKYDVDIELQLQEPNITVSIDKHNIKHNNLIIATEFQPSKTVNMSITSQNLGDQRNTEFENPLSCNIDNPKEGSNVTADTIVANEDIAILDNVTVVQDTDKVVDYSVPNNAAINIPNVDIIGHMPNIEKTDLINGSVNTQYLELGSNTNLLTNSKDIPLVTDEEILVNDMTINCAGNNSCNIEGILDENHKIRIDELPVIQLSNCDNDELIKTTNLSSHKDLTSKEHVEYKQNNNIENSDLLVNSNSVVHTVLDNDRELSVLTIESDVVVSKEPSEIPLPDEDIEQPILESNNICKEICSGQNITFQACEKDSIIDDENKVLTDCTKADQSLTIFNNIEENIGTGVININEQKLDIINNIVLVDKEAHNLNTCITQSTHVPEVDIIGISYKHGMVADKPVSGLQIALDNNAPEQNVSLDKIKLKETCSNIVESTINSIKNSENRIVEDKVLNNTEEMSSSVKTNLVCTAVNKSENEETNEIKMVDNKQQDWTPIKGVNEVDEEIITSANNSPYVSVTDLDLDLGKILEDPLEKIDNPSAANTTFASTPPVSSKIISKGYNFNFDEIDDPFATKTKIRLSPTPEKSNQSFAMVAKEIKMSQVPKNNNNRRKSQHERKIKKKAINSTSDKTTSKESTSEKHFDSTKSSLEDISASSIKKNVSEHKPENIVMANLQHEENCQKVDNSSVCTSILKETQCNDEEIKCSEQNLVISTEKSTSSSEQYYSLGTSSGESSSLMNRSKNVFNLPEIDDINFNPFATNSKMRMSPSPTDTQSLLENTNILSKLPFEMQQKPDNNIISFEDNTLKSNKKNTNDPSLNTSNATCSSKYTNDGDSTVREILTEDEDTVEGPFLEADDLQNSERMPDMEVKTNLQNFDAMSEQEKDEHLENSELFIDADAFEFLLNQNKNTTVLDSGKESLFLKFDPLFAKRVSSDGILAALSKVQKRQSTPKKIINPTQKDFSPIEKSTAGPSNDNANCVPFEEYSDDLSSTMTKPMMVVNPAVSSIVTQKKSVTPKLNRRSLTFTSPAMAVIDRLLSLSGNSSHLDHNTSIPQIGREHSETGLAITQLRELLAEKEINVHTLRTESKELKDRLAALEVQVRGLETESVERLTKINELNERLLEKTKMNKSMAIVVEEYERTIASLIAETEHDKKRNAEERMRLIKERDEQTAHLTSMEVSFSDLHSKYEKSKQIILSCKANEDVYKKSIKEFQDNFSKMQNNYELLKQHATSKLNHANQELEKMNRAHEAEVLKMNALIKRKELHITSLEETLAQKTKANEELTAICDELINKVG